MTTVPGSGTTAVVYGPPKRVEWWYIDNGDGHRTLKSAWKSCDFIGEPPRTSMQAQRVIEFVYPWTEVTR